MSDNDIEVKIGADTGGLNSGMDAASHGIKHAMEEITESFKSTHAVGTALGVAMGGLLLGAFEKLTETITSAVSETNEFRESAEMLGRKLGTTATEANNISMALRGVESTTEEYSAASKGMEKILNKNEESLKKMGLTTRDSTGHMRPLNDLMIDGIAIVNTYKEGADRNIAATQIFGRAMQDGTKLLNYNAAAFEEGEARAKRYGLTIGVESVADLKAYQEAQIEATEATKGMGNAAGNALMPVMTKLSEWWSNIAPAAIAVIKIAIGTLAATFLLLKDTIYGTLQIIGGLIEGLGSSIRLVVEEVMALANGLKTGDFSGMKTAWDKAGADMAEIAKRHFKAISDAADETRKSLDHIFGDQTPETKTEATGKEVKTKSPKAPPLPSEIPKMKAELDGRIEQEKGYFKDSLQLEIDFWESKLAVANKSNGDQAKVTHTIFELNKKLAKEELAEKLESLKQQSAAQMQAGTERVRLAHEATVLIGATYGLESKEYKKALMDEVAAMTDFQNQKLKIAAIAEDVHTTAMLAEVDAETQNIAQLKALGVISNLQEIDALMKLEEKKYLINLKAAKDKAALIVGDAVAQAAANAQIEKDAIKHDAEMKKLRDKRVLEEKASIKAIADGTTAAMTSAFTGLLNGTMTLSVAMKSIFKGMLDSIIGYVADFVAKWIVQQTLQRVFGLGTAKAQIATSAGVAGAAGVASAAAIPFYGWQIAPMAGQMDAAAAMAFQGLSSSAGFAVGAWDIPSDGLAKIHKGETILNSADADNFRKAAAGGGTGGGNMTVNISAVDAAGVKKLFMTHGALMADSLKAQARNFKVNR